MRELEVLRSPRWWLLAAALLAACGDGDGGGTPTGDAAPTGTTDAGAGVVTYETVKPIFAAKCTPCHLPGGSAAVNHTLAASYESANQPSAACTGGKKKGECTIVLVKSGIMPFGKGCTGDPGKDTANPACLTAAEQKLLEDWIAGGLRE
jgi:hypothetical protein